MNTLRSSVAMLTLLAVAALVGCSGTIQKSPDVADSVRTALDQAGLKDVSISQDRDKGIVTLGGHVPTESDKAQAETLAKSLEGARTPIWTRASRRISTLR
jgi:osmotically-inducible protein OsmY